MLQLEQGFWFTFLSLLRNPGRALRDYLNGRRQPYMTPFAYLLIGAAISYFVYQQIGALSRDDVEAMLRTQFQEQDITPEAFEVNADFTMIVMSQLALLSVIMAVPFVFAVRLFFPKTLNLAEATVFAIYCFAQVIYIDLASVSLHFLGMSFFAQIVFTQITYVVVLIWFAVTFFQRQRLWAVVRVLLAFGVSVLVVQFLIGVAQGIYVSTHSGG